MDYTNENTSIINQVLFGLSSDTIFLSDSMRIASFLEITKNRINKINRKNNPLKNNNK
jgi:hypothetical protein